MEGWDGSTCNEGETIQRWLHYTILWVHLTQLYATLPVKMVAHVLSQETAHVWMDGKETPAPKVRVELHLWFLGIGFKCVLLHAIQNV